MQDKDKTALYAFRKYGDTVLRCAYAATGSYSEAEDITQEVFLKLHEKPQDFASDDHIKAWLIRAAVNRCINYKKSFRVNRTVPLDEKIENKLSCTFTDEESDVRDKLFRLPEKYGTVLFLYYYEGYSVKEIAGLTGKGENTVSSLLRRGREKLKLEIEKGDAYEEG